MKTRIVKETIKDNVGIYDTQYRCECKIWFWWSIMKQKTWHSHLHGFSYRDAIFSTLEEAERFLKKGQINTIKEIVK